MQDQVYQLVLELSVSEQREGALLELSRWIGSEAPDLEDPVLREPLRLTHHSWDGDLERVWDDAPPPRTSEGCDSARTLVGDDVVPR